MQKTTYRSICISDLHLGAKESNTSFLLDFLRHNDSEYLYLVGDIIDLWQTGRRWHWPPINDEIVLCILEKARRGTRVIYIPGNHDGALRQYAALPFFKGVEIRPNTIHVTANGRRFFICHGDEFDSIARYGRWLAMLGSYAYQLLLKANRYLNIMRQAAGRSYWSLSAFLKYRVKQAVNFISCFEKKVAEAARRNGVDGMICGHIHHASLNRSHNILYTNMGDWVESCTAVVERTDGLLEVIQWTGEKKTLFEEDLCPRIAAYEHSYRHGRLAPTN